MCCKTEICALQSMEPVSHVITEIYVILRYVLQIVRLVMCVKTVLISHLTVLVSVPKDGRVKPAQVKTQVLCLLNMNM